MMQRFDWSGFRKLAEGDSGLGLGVVNPRSVLVSVSGVGVGVGVWAFATDDLFLLLLFFFFFGRSCFLAFLISHHVHSFLMRSCFSVRFMYVAPVDGLTPLRGDWDKYPMALDAIGETKMSLQLRYNSIIQSCSISSHHFYIY